MLEVVSDKAAVFRLLQGEGRVLILDRVLCQGHCLWAVDPQKPCSRAVAKFCGCISGGGRLVEGGGLERSLLDLQAHLGHWLESWQCLPDELGWRAWKPAGVHSATH